MNILVVCTGNMCRSPLAAAMLEARLVEAGVEAKVSSAGVLTQGRSSPSDLVAVARQLGIDLSGHRSTRITEKTLADSDLVIGMAREHVREVVTRRKPLWPRSFTLKELVRRGWAIGPRGRDEELGVWLDRVHEGRRAADLLGSSGNDDVEDPMGGSTADYAATAEEVDNLVNQVMQLAWPRESARLKLPGDVG